MTEKIFSIAKANAKDISDRFYSDLGNAIADIRNLEISEKLLLESVREKAESLPNFGRFDSIESLANPFLSDVESLYRAADIVALDGSNLMKDQIFVSGCHVCIAVAEVSPRSKKQQINLTSTTAAKAEWNDDDINDLLRRVDEERNKQGSWISTFQEWCVRKRAIELLEEYPVLLIDGPVFTQNMLTQLETEPERKALTETSSHVIGFIKELSANPTMHAIGCTLNQGECFLYLDYSRSLMERFDSVKTTRQWVSTNLFNKWTRVVYKLRSRAFGIECRLQDVGLALAIAKFDASMKSGHEIPLLLELADQAVRRMCQDGRIGEMALSRGLRDFNQIVNLTHERKYR